MTTAPIRLIAALALGGQLMPLGVPLVCASSHQVAGGCEQPMAPLSTMTAATGTTGQSSCPTSAFCMVTATAIPVALTSLALPAAHAATIPGVPAVNPADPSAPPSPPPQA